MWSSAIASSSPVLTPGRTAAFTAASAPAVTSPEARISSISCAVLIWIICPLHFASRGSRASKATPRSPCTGAPAVSVLGRDGGLDLALGFGLGLAVSPQHRRIGAQGFQGAPGDLLDLADGVDLGQLPGLLVELRERGRLFPVHLEAVPNGLGLVVVPLHPLTVDQHASTGQSADQLLLVDDQLQATVQPVAHLGQRVAQ